MQVRTFSELQSLVETTPIHHERLHDLRQKTLKRITANLDDKVVSVPFPRWVEIEICESENALCHEAAAVFTKKMTEIKNDLGLPADIKTTAASRAILGKGKCVKTRRIRYCHTDFRTFANYITPFWRPWIRALMRCTTDAYLPLRLR